jgi:hypothetical protein
MSQNLLRSLLRSAKFPLQDRAMLRTTARKRNEDLPSGSNGMQSGETMRNSLGLNYESPALTAELQARCS